MTLSDVINRMIEVALNGVKISSASKAHTNTVTSITEIENPDLESEISTLIEESIENNPNIPSDGSKQDKGVLDAKTKADKKLKNIDDKLTELDTTSLNDLKNLTNQQVRNLESFSKDPFKFVFGTVFKKLAKGAGVIALASIIFSAVQLIIAELMKPGRLLDRRFKRVARDEILLFNSREEQAELRQGFRTVTVTTIPFLRGSEIRGQISGNLYNPTAIPMNRLDERRVIAPIIKTQNSSRASKFFRRRNR